MTIDITSIAQAVIALMAALITTFLIPYIKSKLTADEQTKLVAWVKFAVQSAQQIYDITEGTVKKEYVLDYLRQMGYNLDDEAVAQQVNALIEASVYELKNG